VARLASPDCLGRHDVCQLVAVCRGRDGLDDHAIGFPFAWQSWSDVIFNDDSFRPMMTGLGAVLDLVAFVAVAALIARAAPPSTGVLL